MKKMILMAVAVIMGTLAGCDTSTNDIESSNSATAGVLTGKLLLGNTSGYQTSAGAVMAKVCMNGVCGYVSGDGSYSVHTNATVAIGAGFAGRAGDDSLLGSAYIVVNGDTLKEIPVTSWGLPTGYMVQRNYVITTGSRMTGDSAQLVYWTSDSVAYVAGAARDQGSSTPKYSGDIYNYYDSAAYVSNSTLFRYFVRTYKGGRVLAYSNIYGVTAKNGDFSTDSANMHLTAYNQAGYSYVPELDTVTKWMDSTALNRDGRWVPLNNPTMDTTFGWTNYCVTAADTAKWADAIAVADSFKMTYTLNKGKAGRLSVSPLIHPGTNVPYLEVDLSGAVTVNYDGITDTAMLLEAMDCRGTFKLYVDANGLYPIASVQNADTIASNIRIFVHVKN